MHVIRHEALSAEAHYGQAWTVAEQEQPFRVCPLSWDDPRLSETTGDGERSVCKYDIFFSVETKCKPFFVNQALDLLLHKLS